MKPTILVITPTLGNRETLEKTINSVKSIGEGYVDHFIIVPNFCFEKIKNKYTDSKIISEPKNLKKGIYPSLNYAFNLLGKNYDYITFINDDDYWLPNFKILIEALENDKNIEIIYSKVNFVNEKNEIIKKQASSSQFYDFLSLLHSDIVLFTQQATIIKSDLYFQLGGFSEDFQLISDTKFWIDLSYVRPKYKYINKYCAAYTLQKSQLSSDKNLQKLEHKKLLKLYPNISIIKVIKDRIIFRFKNINIYLNRIKS